jgi:hypothetical protein
MSGIKITNTPSHGDVENWIAASAVKVGDRVKIPSRSANPMRGKQGVVVRVARGVVSVVFPESDKIERFQARSIIRVDQ